MLRHLAQLDLEDLLARSQTLLPVWADCSRQVLKQRVWDAERAHNGLHVSLPHSHKNVHYWQVMAHSDHNHGVGTLCELQSCTVAGPFVWLAGWWVGFGIPRLRVSIGVLNAPVLFQNNRRDQASFPKALIIDTNMCFVLLVWGGFLQLFLFYRSWIETRAATNR